MSRKGGIHSVRGIYYNSTENCLLYFLSRHRDPEVQRLGQDDLAFPNSVGSVLSSLYLRPCQFSFMQLKSLHAYEIQSLCLAEDTTVKKIKKGKTTSKKGWFPALSQLLDMERHGYKCLGSRRQ